MNYKSQLKGWAVDRVIEAVKAGALTVADTSIAGITAQSDILAAYAYDAEEDFEATAKYLSELIQKSVGDPLEKIKFLQDELALAEEQLSREPRLVKTEH